MEKLVLTVSNKGDRTSNYYKLKDGELKIGRAFDNDIVIDDPFVSPHQFSISVEDSKVTVKVEEKVNPVILDNRVYEEDSFTFNKGESLSIGKTHLQLISEYDKVAPTKRQFVSKWSILRKVGPVLSIFALLMYGSINAVSNFTLTSQNLQWRDPAYYGFIAAALVLVWASLWAVAGKIYKHQSQFLVQLFVTSLIGIVFIFTKPIPELFEFQFSDLLVGKIISYVISFISVFILLKVNISIATHTLRSNLIAFLCSAFLIGLVLVSEEYYSDTYNYGAQQYSNSVKPPFAVISRPTSVDDYLQKLSELEISIEQP